MFFEDEFDNPQFIMEDNMKVLFYYFLFLFILQYYNIIRT